MRPKKETVGSEASWQQHHWMPLEQAGAPHLEDTLFQRLSLDIQGNLGLEESDSVILGAELRPEFRFGGCFSLSPPHAGMLIT